MGLHALSLWISGDIGRCGLIGRVVGMGVALGTSSGVGSRGNVVNRKAEDVLASGTMARAADVQERGAGVVAHMGQLAHSP